MRKVISTLMFGIITLQSYGQKPTVLHISPMDAHGGSSSQIFDSIDFIPLETTKESLFGKIDQLEITQDYFVILDRETKSILFFKKNGKFVFKIKPPQNKNFLSYFSIDQDQKKLIVITDQEEIAIYDLNGKFLEEKELPENINSLYCFQNGNIAYNFYRPVDPSEQYSTKYDISFFKNYNSPVSTPNFRQL